MLLLKNGLMTPREREGMTANLLLIGSGSNDPDGSTAVIENQ